VTASDRKMAALVAFGSIGSRDSEEKKKSDFCVFCSADMLGFRLNRAGAKTYGCAAR
jgi:hypothetical protein